MPVDFRLTGSGLDTTFRLWNNSGDQYFSVHVPTLPTTGQLDPNNWILKTATPVSVGDEEAGTPLAFRLDQNYPNPFNPNTSIGFSVPPGRDLASGGQISEYGLVTLKVFDLLGREVATLVHDVKQPGTYTTQWDASNIASGVYIYRLQSGDFIASRKLLLLR